MSSVTLQVFVRSVCLAAAFLVVGHAPTWAIFSLIGGSLVAFFAIQRVQPMISRPYSEQRHLVGCAALGFGFVIAIFYVWFLGEPIPSVIWLMALFALAQGLWALFALRRLRSED